MNPKLLPCPACQAPVSSHATLCPHCGYPIQDPPIPIRRIICITLVAALTLLVIAAILEAIRSGVGH